MQSSRKQTPARSSKDPTVGRSHFELLFNQLACQLEDKKTSAPFATNFEMDRLSELANLIAMSSLKEADFEKCERYLKRADRYSRHSMHMLLATHNNWSCYYKKAGNSNMALAHINKAIKLAKQIEQSAKEQNKHTRVKLLGDCYLNLCVVLSTFGEHSEALRYVDMAISRFEGDLEEILHNRQLQLQPNKMMDRKNVLAIAKYNRATELEHLKRMEAALEEYRGLKLFLVQHFGEEHALLNQVNKAIKDITTTTRTHRKSESTVTARHFYSVNTEDNRLPNVLKEHSNNVGVSSRRMSLFDTTTKHLKDPPPTHLATTRQSRGSSLAKRNSNPNLKRCVKATQVKML